MPPHSLAKGAFFFFCSWLPLITAAQESAVLSTTSGPDSLVASASASEAPDAPRFARAKWSGVNGNAVFFTFQRTNIATDRSLALDQLVIAGLEQYLDDRIHFTREGVQTDLDAAHLAAGMDRMIGAAASHFDQPAPRLSQATLQQLGRVCRIDWSRANFGIDGGEDQEKYLAIYYYVRAQRQELERQMTNDLLGLAAFDVLAIPSTGTAGRMNDAVPTVCNTVFDDENYLCALDLKVDSIHGDDVRLTDSMLSGIAARVEAEVPQPGNPPTKIRKRDRWLKAELDAINDRIDKIDQRKELWVLRDRIDDLEGRMDDIGMQVQEIQGERSSTNVPDHPVANLSALTGHNVTFRFAKNSATLSAQQRLLLSEVARSMAMEGDGRLLITGYADRSGNPAVNMAISEARAKAVREFLRGAGIDGERLLLNYFGDSRSSGTGADERRVELQWLK